MKADASVCRKKVTRLIVLILTSLRGCIGVLMRGKLHGDVTFYCSRLPDALYASIWVDLKGGASFPEMSGVYLPVSRQEVEIGGTRTLMADFQTRAGILSLADMLWCKSRREHEPDASTRF